MSDKKKKKKSTDEYPKDWDLKNLKPVPMPEPKEMTGKFKPVPMPQLEWEDEDSDKLRLYKTLDKVMSGNKKKKFSRGGGVAMRGLGNATYSKKDI
jgi:hypothetical protein